MQNKNPYSNNTSFNKTNKLWYECLEVKRIKLFKYYKEQ